jgi:ribosomal protein L17
MRRHELRSDQRRAELEAKRKASEAGIARLRSCLKAPVEREIFEVEAGMKALTEEALAVRRTTEKLIRLAHQWDSMQRRLKLSAKGLDPLAGWAKNATADLEKVQVLLEFVTQRERQRPTRSTPPPPVG